MASAKEGREECARRESEHVVCGMVCGVLYMVVCECAHMWRVVVCGVCVWWSVVWWRAGVLVWWRAGVVVRW